MNELYCCYGGSAQDERLTCCGEYHFVPWEDLDADMREALETQGEDADEE